MMIHKPGLASPTEARLLFSSLIFNTKVTSAKNTGLIGGGEQRGMPLSGT